MKDIKIKLEKNTTVVGMLNSILDADKFDMDYKEGYRAMKRKIKDYLEHFEDD